LRNKSQNTQPIALYCARIVLATAFYDDPSKVAEAQEMVDERKSMMGFDLKTLELKMQERGTA
jgi:pyridoxal 5'-phosphate synthase pdxS subunit